MALARLRRGFGTAGIVLLGIALALAPVLAFGGDMRVVTGLGIAGIACLIVMRLLPRPPEPATPASEPEPESKPRDAA